MPTLLLTLHLLQLPAGPEARLRLLPELPFRTASALTLSAPPAREDLLGPLTPGLLGLELGGGVLALVLGQAAVVSLETLGVLALEGGSTGAAGGLGVPILLGMLLLGGADLLFFPLLAVGGAYLVARWMGGVPPMLGGAVPGAYLATLGLVGGTALALLVEALALGSTSAAGATALNVTALGALAALPIFVAAGATVGLNLDSETFHPLPAPIPDLEAPPQLEPPPRANAPGRPTLQVRLLTLHFG